MSIDEIINTGMSYVQTFTAGARGAITHLIGGMALMIIMLVISLVLGYLIAKVFHMRPLSLHYAPATILIGILIFIILMYV